MAQWVKRGDTAEVVCFFSTTEDPPTPDTVWRVTLPSGGGSFTNLSAGGWNVALDASHAPTYITFHVTAPPGLGSYSAITNTILIEYWSDNPNPTPHSLYTASVGVKEAMVARVAYWDSGISNFRWTQTNEITVYAARPTSGGDTPQVVWPGIYLTGSVWQPEIIGNKLAFHGFHLESEDGTGPYSLSEFNNGARAFVRWTDVQGGQYDVHYFVGTESDYELSSQIFHSHTSAEDDFNDLAINTGWSVSCTQVCPLGVYEATCYMDPFPGPGENPSDYVGRGVDGETGWEDLEPVEFLFRIVVFDAAAQYPPDEYDPDGCDPPEDAPVAVGVGECCGKHHVLTWTAVGDADGYRVYASSYLIYQGPLLTFTRDLTRLEMLEDQEYMVLAYNDCGEGPSDTVTIERYHRRASDPATVYGRGSDPVCANERVASPTTVYQREGCS